MSCGCQEKAQTAGGMAAIPMIVGIRMEMLKAGIKPDHLDHAVRSVLSGLSPEAEAAIRGTAAKQQAEVKHPVSNPTLGLDKEQVKRIATLISAPRTVASELRLGSVATAVIARWIATGEKDGPLHDSALGLRREPDPDAPAQANEGPEGQ